MARREGQTQSPRQPAKEVIQELEGLARFLLAFVPHASVTTTDLLPRATSGFFNQQARLIAHCIAQQDERHHHVKLPKPFLVVSRVKTNERYVLKEIFYVGSNGVHMNSFEYRTLTEITDWLLQLDRRNSDSTRITEQNHELSIHMKF